MRKVARCGRWSSVVMDGEGKLPDVGGGPVHEVARTRCGKWSGVRTGGSCDGGISGVGGGSV